MHRALGAMSPEGVRAMQNLAEFWGLWLGAMSPGGGIEGPHHYQQ